MNDPLALDVPAPESAPVPAPEPTVDTTADLKPEELKTAIAALPIKGTICVLTPRLEALERLVEDLPIRVASLEKKLADFDTVVDTLVPLLKAAGELAARVEAIEKTLATTPASPAAHDARIQVLEDAIKGLAPVLEQHFGIKF